MFQLVLAFALIALTNCQNINPPIPMLAEDPGIIYNDRPGNRGKVRVDAFIELNCPDSSAAWPMLKQVAEFYGRDDLELAVHQFSLPYHRNAFICTQGFYQVADKAPESLWDYQEAVFANILDYVGSINKDKSENDIVATLSALAEETTGISAAEFASDIDNYTGTAIYTWKYATRRGVSGTPWYMVNDIDIGVNPSVRLTFQDWVDFLDPLIN
uniref:Thioredoxin-like fold domain-containing protein n=1 Tax=Phragmatopoma lapidosa TaxID=341668 RepID=A0A0A0QXJ6_9ANNE|nr:hypothetical protein [Phragmatopoma lapidosa]